MLELLLLLMFGAALVSSASRGYTTYLSSVRQIERSANAHSEVTRLATILGHICNQVNQRFGVNQIDYVRSHLITPAKLGNAARVRVKQGSSSISIRLANTTNVFSRITENSYCSSQPPEKDTRSFLLVSAAGEIVSERMKHKTRCLLARECPCQTAFISGKNQNAHTIFASNFSATLYLAPNNTFYWLALDSREHQPLAYQIERFRVTPLSKTVLEFEIKHQYSPALSMRCSLGPKEYHVLDSIF